MIIISKYLPKRIIGLTIFPFVFIKPEKMRDYQKLINHERIHLRQQLELLVVFFFIIYSIEFLIRLVYFKNWNRAYRNISFEREAYSNEHDKDYLKFRSIWNFRRYF